MNRRPSTMFRGSELPRMLLLLAIVVAGWPLVALFSRPQEAEPPPPPVVPVAAITPIVPDEGVEFQAIKDKQEVLPRESAAYATLLQRTRETPHAELAAQGRRDVFWAQVWDRPRAYRGVPIHLEGVAKKVLTYEVGPAMSTKGRLYDVWFYSDENRTFPYVVVVEEPPPGLVVGYELNLRVTVDAYFFKLLKYQAGDTSRAAPMLVGRLSLPPAPPPAPAPMIEIRDWTRRHSIRFLVAIVLGYLAFRAFFQVRKVLKPMARPTLYRSASEGLPPGNVAEWLRNLPTEDDDAETEDDDPTPEDRPRRIDG